MSAVDDVELHTGEQVRWTKQKVEEFLALFNTEFSFAQIAAAMGISRNAAIAKAWRLKLTRHGKRITPRMIEEPEKDQRIRDRHVEKPPISLAETPVDRRDTWGSRKAKHQGTIHTKLPLSDHPVFRLNGGCKWPIGEPGSPEFKFCGGERVDIERPYCAEHRAVAYKPKL